MDEQHTTIRTFRESDRDAVIALWKEAFPNDPPWNEPTEVIRRKSRVQPELFFVAQTGESVVGTVLAGYDGVRGWIYHLAVHSSRRGRGIARLLMQTAEQSLSRLGCPKVNLQVRLNNASVVSFYTQLGYEVEERVQFGKPLSSTDPQKTWNTDSASPTVGTDK